MTSLAPTDIDLIHVALIFYHEALKKRLKECEENEWDTLQEITAYRLHKVGKLRSKFIPENI